MSFFKKTTVIALTVLMLTMTFQSAITHAEERGVNIMVGKCEGIYSTGIWGPSSYDITNTKITFSWNNYFYRRLNKNYGTNTVFEVDPDLIPYVDRIQVVNNMVHGTKPQGLFTLFSSSPGVFVVPTIKVMDVGNCPWAHTAQATIILKVPVSKLPKDNYVYSVKLTDPKQGNQYVIKTRVQGVIEKKPVQYSTLDYGVFKSMFGFNAGRPLSGDTQLNLRYGVEYRITQKLPQSNYEFHFDPALIDYIDYIEIFNGETNKLVLSTSLAPSGIISMRCLDIYKSLRSYYPHPIDLKVHLRNGMTVGDLPNDVYKITALSSYTPSSGRDIHKNSVCTLAFKTNIDY